jgi:HEAT repeat protein
MSQAGIPAVVIAFALAGCSGIQPAVDDLHNPRASVRAAAARSLADSRDARAVKPLISAFEHDSSLEVRQAAAESLGALGDRRAVSPLCNALRTTTDALLPFVAHALGAIADRHAVEPLIDFLSRRHGTELPIVEARREAIKALGRIGDARAYDTLTALQRSRDFFEAKHATESLAKLGRGVLAKLTLRMTDRDPRVRADTAQTLGKTGEQEAVDPLLEALNDRDANVRSRAATALGELGSVADTPEVASELERHFHDRAIGDSAAQSLVKIGPGGRLRALVALQSSSAAHRLKAVTGLASIADPTFVQPLLLALRDSDSRVRAQAAHALAPYMEREVNVALIHALDDRAGDVAVCAARSLACRNDPDVTSALLAQMRMQRLDVVAAAADFFIHRNDAESEAIVIAALNQAGSPQMATALVDSGNPKLIAAATDYRTKLAQP